MQGLITLLFLVGMFISWYSQQKKKQQELERINRSREELKKKRLQNLETVKKAKKKKDEVYQDLKEHHIKSNIKYSAINEDVKLKPLEKIDRLSYFKKAIIWKEIFERKY